MIRSREILLENLSTFENSIHYSFSKKENLLLALTHSSFANENKNESIGSNERLEFLGDAILNFVISEFIYTRYPALSEGEMTKARANMVCEPSLARCAGNIKIGSFLLLGKGEKQSGGNARNSILADAFEALIGAIYIDSGMENVKTFVLRQMQEMLDDSIGGVAFVDYKTQLQEIVQRNGEKKISYEIIEEKGPDHNKVFVAQVTVAESMMGKGKGKSKKEAEQNAAKAAMESM